MEHAGQEDASVPVEEVVPPAQGAHCRSLVVVQACRKVPGVFTHVVGVLLQATQEPVCAEVASDHVPERHAVHTVSAVDEQQAAATNCPARQEKHGEQLPVCAAAELDHVFAGHAAHVVSAVAVHATAL